LAETLTFALALAFTITDGATYTFTPGTMMLFPPEPQQGWVGGGGGVG
jgi:hypothetical protein